MIRLTVKLLASNYNRLRDVARSRGLTIEETFVFALSNGIKVYTTMETGGAVRLFNQRGHIIDLRIARERTWFKHLQWLWLRRYLRSSQLRQVQTLVEDAIIQNLTDLAEVWGFSKTDVINRVIAMSCAVERQLAPDRTVFLRDSEGALLGQVSFD